MKQKVFFNNIIFVPVVKDDHLLTHLPLIVFHVVPVQDGQRDDQGGGDGQKGDQDGTEVGRDQTEKKKFNWN